jgi:predicted chitinase
VTSSIGFDLSTGKLSILGDTGNNTVQEWISDDGYLQLVLDGHAKSSDPLSAFFDTRLQGATRETITRINFDGGEGRDTLLVGNQSVDNLEIAADDDVLINGNAIASGSLDVSADTITTTGSLTGSNISLNSRDALKLESGTKITSQTGDKGGTVHLLGQEVSLTGVAIDASGVNGGGTVLIGGDYQGKGSVPNARTTFIDASTVINVDALQNGDGGRAIVWADDSTRFLGKIDARGGSESGDGGFAEVSGKQNLSFNGTANLDAITGKLGTLLLDPDNIRIADLAEVTDADPNIYNYRSLESISGNVLLEATKNITIDPNISLLFRNPLSSVTFIAGEQFNMDSNTQINAAGKTDITISAKGIEAGNISTRGGKINLIADDNISISSLSSYYGGDIGGNIDVSSKSGSIKFEEARTLEIAAGGIYTEGGRINLAADGDISVGSLYSRGGDIGGNIDITSKGGSIKFEGDRTVIDEGSGEEYIVSSTIESSGDSISGNISLKAEKFIDLGESISTRSSGNVGNISITSLTGDILNIGSLSALGFGTGSGGAIKLKSEQGGISSRGSYGIVSRIPNGSGDIEINAARDINLGSIESYSNGFGDGGRISLNSANGNITTGHLVASSGAANQGTGGDVKVDAAKDIYVQYIDSSSSGSGNSGMIKLKSDQGNVSIGVFGDLYTSFIHSNSNSGIGGNIEVDAAKDISIAGNIVSNSDGSGNGGAITLTSTDGNITTGSLRSDSTQGTGGNITIDAVKLVKVTGSENIDGIDYSIYTNSVDDASGPKGASVTINNSQKVLPTPSTFIIGDATINGTFAGVSDGVATFDTSEGGIHAFVVDGDLNDIHVKMPTFIASSGSPAPDSALDKVIKGMLPFLKGLSASPTLSPLDQARILVSVLPQVTLQQVLQIAPDANPQKASQLLPYLNVAMAIYGINTPIRKSHFFAQLIQESDSFNATEEYADGSDYEGVRGLGNTEPGDGKRFKGRGLIQITGRAVYTDFSNHLGLGQTLLKLPQQVSVNPALATLSAGYFWKIFKGEDLSLKADQDVTTNSEEILRYITQTVNGGLYEGEPTYLSRRRVYLANAKRFFPN